ncbi:hypothetical protein BCR44DRAFT_27232 [Catenaria anguillulae PL171]|uniref:Uncharacterized protein n=1 Tax=Catenaria anguillulae PL171 TaxID=765915 RepID=A0A1Y2HRN0_9FUNG|nr:hypothetical protein BCR44DRAFT_27232 [Catenaria anguillulae PL171]
MCARVLRDNLISRHNTIALTPREQGLQEFPRDPQFLLMAATYLQVFFGQEGEKARLQVMQVLQSDKGPRSPLHIRFGMYCNERANRETGRHVLDSATIGVLMHNLRKYHLLSMCSVRDAWEAVRTGDPQAVLVEIVSKLANYKSIAEQSCLKLRSRSGRDKNIYQIVSPIQSLPCPIPSKPPSFRRRQKSFSLPEPIQAFMSHASGAGGIEMHGADPDSQQVPALLASNQMLPFPLPLPCKATAVGCIPNSGDLAVVVKSAPMLHEDSTPDTRRANTIYATFGHSPTLTLILAWPNTA